MHKHSPRPCITMDRCKQVDQTEALWRAGPGTQAATGQLQMPTPSRLSSVMDIWSGVWWYPRSSGPPAPGPPTSLCPINHPCNSPGLPGGQEGSPRGPWDRQDRRKSHRPLVPAAQTSTEQRPGQEGSGGLSDCSELRQPPWLPEYRHQTSSSPCQHLKEAISAPDDHVTWDRSNTTLQAVLRKK